MADKRKLPQADSDQLLKPDTEILKIIKTLTGATKIALTNSESLTISRAEVKDLLLNVVEEERGVVVRRLVYNAHGDTIDCLKMRISGVLIPPYIDKVGVEDDIFSDALFILLVENVASFIRLVEDRFYNRFPCLIMTGNGQPDVGTRLFLTKIKMELKLPVFALVDCDPYGSKCAQESSKPDIQHIEYCSLRWEFLYEFK